MTSGIKMPWSSIMGTIVGFLLLFEEPLIGSDSIIGPRLRLRMDREIRIRDTSFKPAFEKGDSGEWGDVFIRTDDPSVLDGDGIVVRSSLGPVVTAFVHFGKLNDLAENPAVRWIEESSGCRPLLDRSMADIGVPSLWNGGLGRAFRGNGVIMGFVDYGIDWRHEDFRAASGKTRILFLWDQTDLRGFPPEGFGYGSEYTQEQIDQAILSGNDESAGGIDSIGHGTHVAGIAAGNGRAAGNGKLSGVYVGAAPDADLIIVKGSGSGMIPDTRVIDGLKYIFDKADSLEKPAVVNLSVGTQSGPHDGSSLYEQSVDALLDFRGRAVIAAAGNDGSNPIHFAEEFSYGGTDTLSVPFFVGQGTAGSEDAVSFDIWYETFTGLSSWVRTPSGVLYGPMNGTSQSHWSTAEGDISAAAAEYSENNDMELVIRISDSRNGGTLDDCLSSGTWRLVFQANHSGRFDGWLYESSLPAYLTDRIDFSTSISEPGNARLAITVASYITRDEWPSLYADPWSPGSSQIGDRSDISSIGPTRDGRSKPEISAPGEYVVSSLSKVVNGTPDPRWVSSDSVHWAMRGTSMAAPHVSGTAALLFEKNPNQWSSDIKGNLIETARTDIWTGSCPNSGWGYGKLDALAAMEETSSVSELPVWQKEEEMSLANYPNPFNRNTVIELNIPNRDKHQDASLDIFSVTGRRVWFGRMRSSETGMVRIIWSGSDSNGKTVEAGVYILKLSSGGLQTVRKCVFCP